MTHIYPTIFFDLNNLNPRKLIVGFPNIKWIWHLINLAINKILNILNKKYSIIVEKNEQFKLICEKEIQTTVKTNNLIKSIASLFAKVVHRQRRYPTAHFQLC